ncbi:unnamed protein product [Linum trigynum]|uniref:F-box domain-containing protein n=1 Tax=Linum trigynum TaxID=586398 RepID=A0AAV2GSC8_9ROSI
METTEIAPTAQSKLPKVATGDWISSLPDEILSHILSFLPTKYAVGTSCLSRRWKDLWTGLYELDLDNRDTLLGNTGNRYEILRRQDFEFTRFVDRVLREHKDLNSLRRFRIHFDAPNSKVSPNLLMRLRLASDESRLEEMDVSFEVNRSCLPDTLYSLNRLKILKLNSAVLQSATKGSVLLPSLNMLQLLRVRIKDCESLSSLISGCPVLETLHLENCYYSNRKEGDELIASLPYLKNLTVISKGFLGNQLCSFIIEAPCLEQLYLDHFSEFEFLDSSRPMSCLHSVHIDIGHYRISERGLIRFLAHVSSAKEIHLSPQILNVMLDFHRDVQLPIFPNLTRLTIEDPESSFVLHSLLNSAPKLQSIVIDLRDASMSWTKLARTPRPQCLLSSLEEIKVKNIYADEDQMNMVAYLLKAGAVLKKVDVHLYEDVNYNDLSMQHRAEDRDRLGSLLKLPRGSKACEAHLFLPNGDEIGL